MRLLFLCLFFVPLLADAQNQNELKNNISLQSFEKVQDAEKERTGYLKRSFLPTLSFEVGQERFQTGRYRSYTNPYGLLELRFNLFRGGRDRIESSFRDLQREIAGHDLSANQREELNKVRKLQWQIIYNEKLLELLKSEKKENAKLYEKAHRRVRSGVVSSTDTLEFKIYVSELDEAIEGLQHEVKILKIGLLPLLGFEKEEELTFAPDIVHEHDETILHRSFTSKTHPKVARLDAEYAGYELQKTSLNRWWTPAFDVYGGYYLYTLRDRDYLAIDAREDRVVGVKLTFELFDGMKSMNLATATHYQAEAKRLMARHQERLTDAQFRMLQEDLKHTHEVMHYVQDRIKKSRDYLAATLSEYDRGVKNSLDALTALQRYYRYEKQYLEKKKDYQLIKADLLAILGE